MASPTEKMRNTARDVVSSFGVAARDVSQGALGAARTAADLGRTGTVRLRGAGATAVAGFPADAVPEIARSVNKLRTVRTPRQAVDAFETETERLFTVVAPMLVEHPLPVRRTSTAKGIVAAAGGLAAAGEEMEELAGLVSAGATLPPTLPVMIGANLVALVVEMYVAASLRVHDLRDAGFEPEPNEVARDVIFAMTGKDVGQGAMTHHATRAMIKSIVTRVLSRWGAAFVPFVGIAYSGWDAQRTVSAVRALPLPARTRTLAAGAF
jgi:hypothetical protein